MLALHAIAAVPISSIKIEGNYEVFFDASGTLQRAGFLEMACESSMIKAVYCEKPTATESAEAVRLARRYGSERSAGFVNGV